jgi:hypothetical protein
VKGTFSPSGIRAFSINERGRGCVGRVAFLVVGPVTVGAVIARGRGGVVVVVVDPTGMGRRAAGAIVM